MFESMSLHFLCALRTNFRDCMFIFLTLLTKFSSFMTTLSLPPPTFQSLCNCRQGFCPTATEEVIFQVIIFSAQHPFTTEQFQVFHPRILMSISLGLAPYLIDFYNGKKPCSKEIKNRAWESLRLKDPQKQWRFFSGRCGSKTQEGSGYSQQIAVS